MTTPPERPNDPTGQRAPRADEAAASGRPAARPHGRVRATGKARRAANWGKRKYPGSWAEHLWTQLDAVDFVNRAMLLAATLLLCAVPFLLIIAALAGRSAAAGVSRRMGLNKQAADDVGQLFTSSANTSAAITGLSWVFFILAGLAAAAAVQQLYQRIFQVAPRPALDRLGALGWLAFAVGCLSLAAAVMPGLRATTPVLFWTASLVAPIAFWWCGMWLLLAAKLSWRRLLPSAVATGACWTGMQAVFAVIFSGMIVEYNDKYGSIGLVFALMSFFIAIGVVLTLGAVLGQVWQDRGLSFRGAVSRLRRTP
ncbi:YhjD/YihY/BrkB family envelope integrity protein [Yinghuangia aomiensis]